MDTVETTYEFAVTGNGSGRRVAVDADWRTKAMLQALKAGPHQMRDALLREIRASVGGKATLLASADRDRLMEFLQSECSATRPLLPRTENVAGDDRQASVYLGWYSAVWEGTEVEVVLPSFWGGPSSIIVIADKEKLAREFVFAAIEFCERPTGRSLRYAYGWENAPELDEEIAKVRWDDIVLPEETLSRVRESVEGFYAAKSTFHALGFPWKRGVLLIGPPGTGKTMVCKAAASSLPGVPFLYVRDLRDVGECDAIQSIFERARRLAPCILAFEDLDGFVSDFNRTVFLNELDGFQNNDGLLVIASSNHPGEIDEALLKRPSRFDRVFHLGLPAAPERAEYCRRLITRSNLTGHLSPDLDIDGLADRVAKRSDGFTPAYLKEAFLSAALERAQSGDLVLDARFGEAVIEQIDSLREYLKKIKTPDRLGEMRSTEDQISLRS
jgi:AAA+ superfamily predicted ATPase